MSARRAGFVMIAALWLIVALSAVGLDAALRSQARRAPAMNQLDIARSREAATAGAEYARSRLTAVLLDRALQLRSEARDLPSGPRGDRAVFTALSREDPWRLPQELVPASRELGDALFTIELRDAGERLNINEATAPMLRALLSEGLRIDYAQSDRIAQAIMDWRDGDDITRINGGERDDYIEAGAPVLPANHAFTSVDELRHVLGMTPSIFEAMLPHVTVIGSGRISLNAASAEVLHAIPTFNTAAVSTLLRLRQGGQFPGSASDLEAMLGRLWQPERRDMQEFNRRVTYATNEIEIIVTGRVRESPVTATVRALAARADTRAIMVWRRFE